MFGAPKPDEKKDEGKKDGTGAISYADRLHTASPNTLAVAPSLFGTVSTEKKDAATVQVAVPPPSVLKGKTIEEIVNRWSTELETHVREFNRFAGEVGVWDRALIENGNNVGAKSFLVFSFSIVNVCCSLPHCITIC